MSLGDSLALAPAVHHSIHGAPGSIAVPDPDEPHHHRGKVTSASFLTCDMFVRSALHGLGEVNAHVINSSHAARTCVDVRPQSMSGLLALTSGHRLRRRAVQAVHP